MHCYATGSIVVIIFTSQVTLDSYDLFNIGRLPYLSDAEATSSLAGALNFVASCFWVPIWCVHRSALTLTLV